MIDIKFTLEDCKIIYECTGMDERLRGKLDFITKFIEEPFAILSIECPEIEENILYLRGMNATNDNDINSIEFNCNHERDAYANKVKTAFVGLKAYLKRDYPDDYTEPTLTIIDKDEKESAKLEDAKENEEYEYLTVEKAKALYDKAEKKHQIQ